MCKKQFKNNNNENSAKMVKRKWRAFSKKLNKSFNKEVNNNINYDKEVTQVTLRKASKRFGNQGLGDSSKESFTVMNARLVQIERETDGKKFQRAYL